MDDDLDGHDRGVVKDPFQAGDPNVRQLEPHRQILAPARFCATDCLINVQTNVGSSLFRTQCNHWIYP
jgi:hypothetical protein